MQSCIQNMIPESPVTSPPVATAASMKAGAASNQAMPNVSHQGAQVSQQQPQQQITMPTPVQGVRPIGNAVRVRASTSAGAAATPTAGGGQQIKVVGAKLRQTAVIGGQIRLASPGKLAIELSFKQKNG